MIDNVDYSIKELDEGVRITVNNLRDLEQNLAMYNNIILGLYKTK